MKIIRRLKAGLTQLVGLTILTYTAMITGALAALPSAQIKNEPHIEQFAGRLDTLIC